jgi:uncharacterized protein YecE (DUF72 family)
MGWSYSFWKPTFYPKNLPSKDFLSFYANHFNTVEVDSTFYRIPTQQTVTEWTKQTPDEFLFSFKFPQKITHIKLLRDCEEETRVFLERVGLAEKKLGVLLLQFPHMFRQEHLPLLAKYLKTLPTKHHYAVEIRNKSLLNGELIGLLKDCNVALAWVDAAKMPFVPEETADFVYVRWEGDRKTTPEMIIQTEPDRTAETPVWVERLKPILMRQVPVFGYYSKYYASIRQVAQDIVPSLRRQTGQPQ